MMLRDAETSTDGVSATILQRTALLFRIAAMLKRLAHDHHLAILLVNQVCLSATSACTAAACSSNMPHDALLGELLAISQSFVLMLIMRHTGQGSMLHILNGCC